MLLHLQKKNIDIYRYIFVLAILAGQVMHTVMVLHDQTQQMLFLIISLMRKNNFQFKKPLYAL